MEPATPKLPAIAISPAIMAAFLYARMRMRGTKAISPRARLYARVRVRDIRKGLDR